MSVRSKASRFIEDTLLDEPTYGRDPLAEGMVDSLGIEQLAAWSEEEFGVTFVDEDFVMENFSSITAFADLVRAKRRGARSVR